MMTDVTQEVRSDESPGVPGPANGMATAALVLGVVALCLFWLLPVGLVLGVMAITFGVLGMRKADQLPGRFLHGRAKAGSITGVVATVASIAFFVTLIPVAVEVDGELERAPDPSFTPVEPSNDQ